MYGSSTIPSRRSLGGSDFAEYVISAVYVRKVPRYVEALAQYRMT
jgi:hypothetical protein